MKRIKRCLLLLGVFCLSCSSNSEKKEKEVISMGTFYPYTLLYQSGRQGTVTPSKNDTVPYGGLDREANAVEFIRGNPTYALFADGGNLFAPEKPENLQEYIARAPAIVEALNLMSLDVFAPGPTDWKIGREQLQKLSKQAVFRFVATNVMDDKDKRIFPAYQIVQRGALTFAFLSITPEGWYGTDVHATSVKTALNKWVWQAAIRSDFIIVLSQLADVKEDRKILERYPQIKLVIGNDPVRTLDDPLWLRGRLLLDGYRHGYFLGKFTFEFRPPFFGFYNEASLLKVQTLRKEKERELASEQQVERRAALQGELAAFKEGHPEKKPSGSSRFIHELIPLDRARFGKPNEVSAVLSPNQPPILAPEDTSMDVDPDDADL